MYLELNSRILNMGQSKADPGQCRIRDTQHQITLDLHAFQSTVSVGNHCDLFFDLNVDAIHVNSRHGRGLVNRCLVSLVSSFLLVLLGGRRLLHFRSKRLKEVLVVLLSSQLHASGLGDRRLRSRVATRKMNIDNVFRNLTFNIVGEHIQGAN